jgi:replication factor C large subunit
MLAHAIASEFGWELFEFNASDLRDEASVLRILQNAAGFGSLSGARRLVLVDDADALSGTADRGGASAIAAALKSSSQPVILTASDYYSK